MTLEQIENEVLALVSHNLRQIHGKYLNWKFSKISSFTNTLNDIESIWIHWLHFDINSYSDLFQGRQINQKKEKKIIKKKIKSDSEFWNSFNPFDDILPVTWRVRFTNKARQDLLKETRSVRSVVLRRVINISTGFLHLNKYSWNVNCKMIREGPCLDMVYFFSLISPNYFMVFCSEQIKVPELEHGNLVAYSLSHQLKVIGFCSNENDAFYLIENYLKSIKKHTETYVTQDSGDSQSAEKCFRKVNKYFYPKPDVVYYLDEVHKNSVKFDESKKRWISTNNISDIFEDIKKTSSCIKKLSTAEAGKSFKKILMTIPKFSLRLTEQQNKAVIKPDHVVIFGRSGTGKTTTSVLRMFASELLFKNKTRSKDTPFLPEHVKNSSSLHCAFITASPVLTNEVKRYYNKLKQHVCEQLQKKQEKEENLDLLKNINEENQESESSEDEDSGPFSIQHLQDSDFPLFLTFRKFVLLVDAAIRYPFFPRDINGKIIGSSRHMEWNQYGNCMKLVKNLKNKSDSESSELSESDEDDLEESMFTERVLKNYEEIRKRRSYFRSFEVDFAVFKQKFWPLVKKQTALSPLVVWTEIISYIKGSSRSWMYSTGYIPKNEYQARTRKQTLLTRDEMNTVWELFYEYESWKKRVQAYDFQDVINYILSYIKHNGYQGVPVHYLMVDEVQDITNAGITLLLSVCKEKLVFSGDTAQTIAKGVGFRFSDMDYLFGECGLPKPKINKLSINFRTHNQVLDLANSVVSLIECLFPQTIDRMVKETSYIDGPMPIVVPSNNINELVNIVFGMDSSSKEDIQFGCNQVIIVRNNESKSRIPAILSNSLCLTVFEAKGLEFEDVILFNFFTDSDLSLEKWKILMNIEQSNSNDFKEEEEEERKRKQKKEDPDEEEEKIEYVNRVRCHVTFDTSKYALLCNELKHLYVSITRPKKHLIIFDESPDKRRFIENYWTSLRLVKFSEKSEPSQKIVQKSEMNAWKIQGERMMAHKFYEQAAKCFMVCGDVVQESKARAFLKANKASIKHSQTKARITETKESSRKDKRLVINKLKKKIVEAESLFREAAEELEKLYEQTKNPKLLKHIAQCLASGKNYQKAAEFYEKIGFFKQAAESYYSAGDYFKAGDLFDSKGEYVRAIDCFSRLSEWDKVVRCLHRNKERIPDDELRRYVYKYMPAALEAVVPKILPNEGGGFIKKLLEEQKDVIKEESEEEESEDY